MDLEKEVRDLKQRVDRTETRLGQLTGQFEVISGQLRDVQTFMHAKFEQVDNRLDRIDSRLDRIDNRLDRIDVKLETMDQKIDALPRILAEMLTARH